LRMSDPDDRIRAVLGATSDDPVPEVGEKTLGKYHAYLTEKLAFPINAMYEEVSEHFLLQKRRITVTALLDPEEADDEQGLVCEALEDGEKIVLPLEEILVWSGRNRQPVQDYQTWVWNWRGAGSFRPVETQPSTSEAESQPVITIDLLQSLALLALGGAFYGATLGAAWQAVSGADVAIKVGAVVLGLAGAVLTRNHPFGAMKCIRFGRWWCASVGLIMGAAVGGMLGAILTTFVAALLGALVGGILGRMVGKQSTLWFAIAGAMIGIVAQAWTNDADAARAGSWIGAVVVGIGVLVAFLTIGTALMPAMEQDGSP
jgi:Calcium binding